METDGKKRIADGEVQRGATWEEERIYIRVVLLRSPSGSTQIRR